MPPPLPMSPSACEALGKRLCGHKPSRDGDPELLQTLLSAYGETLDVVQRVLLEAGFKTTGRVKSTATLLEKVARGTSLKSVQDIAGARIVISGGRRKQDEVVTAMVHAIVDAGGSAKVVDRRLEPMHGYRAVHLIVAYDGIPVEIQVRTELQDLWAQITERLGDRWGRELRYGEPVKEPDLPVVPGAPMTRQQLLEDLAEASEMIDAAESIQAEREAQGEWYDGDDADEYWATSAQLLKWEGTIRSWLLGLKTVADVQEEAR